MERLFIGSIAAGLVATAVAAADAPESFIKSQPAARPAVRSVEPMPVKLAVRSTESAAAPVNGGCPGPLDFSAPVGQCQPECESTQDRTFMPYGSLEYLIFNVRRAPTPPLVQVVSPEAANIGLDTGRLPPGSAINVFSQFGTDPGTFSGVRGTAGLWLDSGACWGAEVGYTQLFRRSEKFAFASAGIPVIGRAFFDTAAEEPAFLFLSTPDGLQRGYVAVQAPTQLYSGDANIRYKGLSIFSDRTDYLLGVRYLSLREAIGIQSGAAFFDPAFPAPVLTSRIDSTETFRAKNEFYGGQIGSESHFQNGAWSLAVGGKLAMGSVRQQVDISGGTVVTAPGQQPEIFPNQSLLLVQQTNAGQYERDRFAVLPEFWVRAGYQLTCNVRATIGYNIIGLSSAIRAGSTIDATVNSNLAPFIIANEQSNAIRPVFRFNGQEFWAQGLTLGLAVDY